MGGPPSMGRPNPSNTRPNSCGPTRSSASFLRAITRSPSCRPTMSSMARDSTCSFRKPITCDRMERPEEVRTSQKSPMETTGPREAISSPTISVTSPTQGNNSTSEVCWIKDPSGEVEAVAILGTQLVDQAAFNLAQLGIDGSVQQALRSVEKQFAGIQSRIGGQNQVLGRAALLQALSHQRFQAGMHAHAADLTGLQLGK